MRNKTMFVLGVLGLFGILTASLGAQSLATRFDVPFEFIVQGKTMPAGQYNIAFDSHHPGMIEIRSAVADEATFAPVSCVDVRSSETRPTAVFHRYNDRYFLAQVNKGEPGTPGLALPTTKAERESAKTASLKPAETVTLVAIR